jgi:hypothetical protein
MIVGRMPMATIFEPYLLGLGRGPVQARAQLGLELERGVTGQGPRRHVELDVVLRELGLVVLVRDGREHLGIVEVRLHVGVDEVELDLEAGHRPVELEGARVEHLLEHVKVLAHLLAVALPLLAAVTLRRNLCSHGVTQPRPELMRYPEPAFRSHGLSDPPPSV